MRHGLKKCVLGLEKVMLDNDLVYNLKQFFDSQKDLSELEIFFNYTAIIDIWIQEMFESMNFVNLKSLTLGLRSCGLDNPAFLKLAKMIATLDVEENLVLDLGGNTILEGEAIELAKHMKIFEHIKSFSLCLESAEVDDYVFACLQEIITNMTELKSLKLNCTKCMISPEMFYEFSMKIADMQYLENLEVVAKKMIWEPKKRDIVYESFTGMTNIIQKKIDLQVYRHVNISQKAN